MIVQQAAKHLNDVYFGGNWSSSNVSGILKDVSVDEANRKFREMNSLLALTFNQYYFITALHSVLKGESLSTKDALSFDHPVIKTEEKWQHFKSVIYATVNETCDLLEKIDDQQLNQPFFDPKYGTWYRNIHGIIEHVHYHLGQMSILKRLIKSDLL